MGALQAPRFNKRELDVEKLWQLAHIKHGGYDLVWTGEGIH